MRRPGDRADDRRGIRAFAPYLIVFFSALAVYVKTVGFGFIPSWDDGGYVLSNQYIRSLSLENIGHIFAHEMLSNYAPVHLLSYSLDHAAWGLDPRGFHLTNMLLHAVNAALACVAVFRITGNRLGAFTAALLMAVHPLNVENVAWISERKTLLSAFFSLLALINWLRFSERPGLGWYISTIVLFTLAVLSKSTGVVLPAILLAYEFFIKKEDRRTIWVAPLFIISFAGAFAAVWALLKSSSIGAGALSLKTLFGTVYPTMLPIYWKYVGLIIWPVNLSGYYDTPVYETFLRLPVVLSFVAWAFVFVLAFRKGTDEVRFWLLWFWIWFLPSSNIIPIPVYYADRYMYMPSLAFFVLAGEGLSRTGERLKAYRWPFVSAMIIIATVFYGLLSFRRADVWQDELAFWQDTVKKSPGQYPGRIHLGYVYEINNRLDEAEREYMSALELTSGEGEGGGAFAVNGLERIRAGRSRTGRKAEATGR